MTNKLTTLYHDNSLTIARQADGSITFVQEANDVRDGQQIVVIDRSEWLIMKFIDEQKPFISE